ncbi:MAG: UDP-forming cellulose synthase catalytic subunit [Pseudomonadota bacterium]
MSGSACTRKPRRHLGQRLRLLLLALAGLVAFSLVVTSPLSTTYQWLFGGVAFLLVLVLVRLPGTIARAAVAMTAVVVSTRYFYWRATETANTDSFVEGVLSIGMLVSEGYLWLILLLGIVQTVKGRDRQPAPLPADTSTWPTVDVYIPTYNEDPELVADTVLAAQQMDYPADKFRVFILDDGKRQALADFAEKAGAEFIIRPDNAHAKAGNLNHALKKTNGDLIAIFDCDHVPVRGFLQLTAGWFLRDPKIALVQTPHHFYNKDPFEKNLQSGSRLSNEGLLFYGLLQDGSDFWDASFFCGSCAVLRREALEEVGGVAVETVTEDAHTSLKMHRRGWTSAYVRRPLAAGLATESLSVHIGQRMRWARGMIQIFRLDNPFLGPGLTFAQRLCYANAMVHFLFPLPRLYLLLVPLIYLVFGLHVIQASAQELLAYAVPSLIVATVSSTALQARHRQPFWGEIYEATLSFHLLRPTIMTIFKPREGKFNVTAKGLRSDTTYLDTSVLKSQIAVFMVMVAAVAYGLFAVMVLPMTADEFATTLINVVWGIISALFLFMTVIVGREVREVRSAPRLKVAWKATLFLEDGRALAAITQDVSLGGAQIELNTADPLDSETVGIAIEDEDGRIYTAVELVHHTGSQVRVAFQPETIEQRAAIVRAVLGRTAMWKSWDQNSEGSVATSAGLMGEAMTGFVAWWVATLRKGRPRPQVGGSMSVPLAGAVAVLLLVLTAVTPAWAQALPVAMGGADPLEPTRESIKPVEYNLSQFGVLAPITLQGRSNTRGIGFSLRSDEVVTSARFIVPIVVSPDAAAREATLSVQLNGQTVHVASLAALAGQRQDITFDVPPQLFLGDNTLVFRLQAGAAEFDDACETDPTIWAEVSNLATMQLDVTRLPVFPDLNNLPLPFFDPRDASELTLPVVYARRPGPRAIQAGAVVASYWGIKSAYRGARFPVHFGTLPIDDAVVLISSVDVAREEYGVEIDSGATVAIVPNPRSPEHRLLLIIGQDDQRLLEAAQAFALGRTLLTGATAPVEAPFLAARKPYDAPAWIPSDRPVQLGEFVFDGALEGRGITPGILSATFQTAPDLFAGDANPTVPLTVKYRAPGEPWIDQSTSRLDVLTNDRFVSSLTLQPSRGIGLFSRADGGGDVQSAHVSVPVHRIIGQTSLQFYFDLHAQEGLGCGSDLAELKIAIDPTSEIDLSGLHRFANMPNLAYFAQSGFPYTRMADLSETAAILPTRFAETDLQALFQLAAAFGRSTGYPTTKLAIGFPAGVDRFTDRDLIVLGALDKQPLIERWAEHASLQFGQAEIALDLPARGWDRDRLAQALWSSDEGARDRIVLGQDTIAPMLFAFESPLTPKRTVTVLSAGDPGGLVGIAEAVTIGPDIADFQNDFAVVSGGEVSSWSVADSYTVGRLPLLVAVRWQLSRSMWTMPLLFLLSIGLMTASVALIWRRKSALNAELDV